MYLELCIDERVIETPFTFHIANFHSEVPQETFYYQACRIIQFITTL